VPVPKFIKPFMQLGTGIDNNKVVCKYKKNMVMEDMTGDYWGELDI
jgi:hypothetical protein